MLLSYRSYCPTVKSIRFSTVPAASCTSTCHAPVQSGGTVFLLQVRHGDPPTCSSTSPTWGSPWNHTWWMLEPSAPATLVQQTSWPTSAGNVLPVSCGCRSTTALATTASATSTAAGVGAAAGAGGPALGGSRAGGPRVGRPGLGDGHGSGGGRGRRGGGRGLGRILGCEATREQGQRDDRSDAHHDGSPTGVVGCSSVARCTARRRRSSSQAPSVAAITVPAAPPPSWKRARYWRCRPAHLPENSAPTMAPQDPWIVVK